MRCIRAIAILLICVLRAVGATQAVLTAPDFTLSSPWTYSASSDTPEGAWVAPLATQSTINTGPITLPSSFSAGVPVKVFIQWLDYDSSASFTATIGGTTSSSEVLDDRDDNQYWSKGIVVTPAGVGSTLQLNFTRAVARDGRLIALYVTTDTNIVVERDSRALSFTYPAPGTEVGGVDTANLIPNSSFEAGPPGAFWRIIVANGNSRTNSLADLWTTAQAFHGTHSLALPLPVNGAGTYAIEGNPIDPGSNRLCVASVYVKAGASGNATANIYVQSVYTAPSGFTSTLFTVASTTATSAGWTRVQVPFTNIYYPNGQVYVTVLGQASTAATTLYVDALKVERGTVASAYSTAYPVEFTVTPSDTSQVLWINETPALSVSAYNSSGGSLSRIIAYNIYDWTNGLAGTGSVPLTIGAGATSSGSVSLPTNFIGHFRAWFYLTNQSSDVELAYLMVPPQGAPSTLNTNSYFGTHVNASESALSRAQRIGVKWHRAMSQGRMRWSEIEATQGVFTYPNLSVYSLYGVSILGNIGEGSPAWAQAAGQVNVIGAYATNLLSHYNFVHWWEIMNEPDQDATITNSLPYYGQIVQVVAPLVGTWGTSPSYAMAGGGVLTASQITNFMASVTATNDVDGFTVHIYPPNESVAPSLKTQISDVYNKPIWNSEAGVTDKGSYTFAYAPFRYSGSYVLPWHSADLWYDSFHNNAKDILRDFLTDVAYGQTRMFYYDGGQRNIEVQDFISRQFTWMDYDDSVRVKGAALSGLWRQLDGAVGQGPVSGSASLSAYAYLVGSTPFVALWSASTNNLTVTLAAGPAPSALRLYDAMGNTATPSSLALAITPMPLILKGTGGMTLATLTNSVGSATVAIRLDTVAPQLVLATVPRTVGTTWRWFALDDSGVPNESSPNAIQYRYALNGGSYSPWTGATWVEANGTNITVQARDLAGNISTATFPSTPTPPPPGGTNVPVIIRGTVRLKGGVNVRVL